MSKVFNLYSKYYDLLYKDKDYAGEARYIASFLKGKNVRSILELGCGTGKHAQQLNQMGFSVFGIDSSDMMLEQAKSLGINCVNGDARTFRVDRIFDAVISLFHVASYQILNDDLLNFFQTASNHLNDGGVFIFDCWYGPCVINEKPTIKIKKLQNENIKIKRIAIPVVYPNENIVDVNYEIDMMDENNKHSTLSETHRMRYLFRPEIELMLKMTRFDIVKSEEWLSGKEPDFNTWSVVFVCVKK